MSKIDDEPPAARITNDHIGSSAPWQPLKARKGVKRVAVLEAATQLFLERGIHRTSMSELASYLNITKPSLYNYFRSKDDIITECVHLAFVYSSAALNEAEALDGTGYDRVHLFIKKYALVSMQKYGACINRIDDRDLRDDVRQEIRRVNRSIDQRVRAMIHGGTLDGSIVACDVRLTTFAIMGAIQWISRWYRTDGPISPDDITKEYTERLTASLRSN